MPQQQKLLEDEAPFAREVLNVPVATEMRESFLAYSLSVITSRAIPDVRDGLKPVQRRILYSMLRMGIRPETPHRKSARIVGDTMGRYHPHGDTAIYDALVRMGQPFARNITFIEPQGNFGSLDDPPAAPRYTECRLSAAAMAMVRELDEDTVDFRATYDGESEEPEVLPALLPGLLLNGTTGIAVGMATNMPTHNPEELYAAIKLVMTKRRPKPTLEELLACCPGPDFPSGGIVIDDGLYEAYETGRGSIRIRARPEVEAASRGNQAIVVTELPYLVGPERVVAKLKELDEAGRIPGVVDFKNLTDRSTGLRIQILVRKGHNPQAVLNDLYRLTPLEESFGINNVVLVNGEPQTLGFRELCNHYVEHRLNVLIRRTQYRLRNANDRLHIVDGLLKALDSIDEVVAIIRGSKDAKEAQKTLTKRFRLSPVQTDHILNMPLKRLTALENLRIEEEQDQLKKTIANLKKLLESKDRQRKTVLRELSEATANFNRPRRTEIVNPDDLPTHEPVQIAEDLIDEECLVTLSTSGQIGRTSANAEKKTIPSRHDVLCASVPTRTVGQITAITSDGRALHVKTAELLDTATRTRGSPASQVFGTNRGETIHTVVGNGDNYLVLVTAEGMTKRLTLAEVQNTKHGKTLISLKSGDKVAAAFCASPDKDAMIVASDGQALRTSLDNISVQGRGAGGVTGMKLRPGSTVIGAAPTLEDDLLFTVGSQQTAKATPVSDFDTKGRGGLGVRVGKSSDSSPITLAYIGQSLGLLGIMATDNNPKNMDPVPEELVIEPTRRDLASKQTDRQILHLGPARW